MPLYMIGDTISRYQAYAIGIQNGFLAPNEIRVLENRNPMEGGDDIMLPLNMTQAGSKVSGDDVAGNEGRSKRTALFPKGSARRAAFRKNNAAHKALRDAFKKWLRKQVLDIIGLLEDNESGKRSENRASVDDDCQKLMDRVCGKLRRDH